MERRYTADELAVKILLSGKPEAAIQRDLTQLNKDVQIQAGLRCPECDALAGDILDNGCSGRDRAYRCTICDHVWEPES